MNDSVRGRVSDLQRIADAGWARWYRRYRLPEQLDAIRQLGESGSSEALAYLKRLTEPRVELTARSENDGYNNGVDATFCNAKYEAVSFPNAKGELRMALYYEVPLNNRDGEEYTAERIQQERQQAQSFVLAHSKPHRAIAEAIADLQGAVRAS
jgi:hypothetical protein